MLENSSGEATNSTRRSAVVSQDRNLSKQLRRNASESLHIIP